MAGLHLRKYFLKNKTSNPHAQGSSHEEDLCGQRKVTVSDEVRTQDFEARLGGSMLLFLLTSVC